MSLKSGNRRDRITDKKVIGSFIIKNIVVSSVSVESPY